MQTETYKIAQGDNLSKIAQSRGTTVDALMKANPNIKDANKIIAGATLNIPKSQPTPTTEPTFTPTNIQSPTPAPTPVTLPTLPIPTAPTYNESFFTSSSANVANKRKAVEDSYKVESERVAKEKEVAQAEFDRIQEEQGALLDDRVGPLLAPFREKLENAERDRLYINENFEANQSLTRELESLLTEGNELIKASKGQPLAQSVLNKKTQKTIDDVKARAGVIEAVMSARSNQIGEAYRLIDRTSAAITADRKDQLAFYETVFNFYETQKDEKGKKILNLDEEQAKFVEKKIGLLEADLEQADKNAQNIKDLMTDPDSALFMAKAGITLNDSPEVVASKMAKQAEREEIAEFRNDKIDEGYVPVPFKTANAVEFEVAGQKLYFKAPPKKAENGLITLEDGSTVSVFEAAKQFIADNPDASDAELKQALLQLNSEKKLGLDVTEINSLIETRETPALSADDVKTKIVTTLKAQKDTYSKDEAKDLATSQLKKALGIKDDQELPDSYSNSINDAIVEVYGRSFWQKLLPGGR